MWDGPQVRLSADIARHGQVPVAEEKLNTAPIQCAALLLAVHRLVGHRV